MQKKIVTILVLAILFLCGCSVTDRSKEKVADVDFTVVDDSNIPEEIMKMIQEKETESFQMVVNAKEQMYILIGYGQKETSGYSIAVDELYRTSNSIYVKTRLISPKKGEKVIEKKTCPYIVLMLENMDCPVIFD